MTPFLQYQSTNRDFEFLGILRKFQDGEENLSSRTAAALSRTEQGPLIRKSQHGDDVSLLKTGHGRVYRTWTNVRINLFTFVLDTNV